MHSFWIKPNGEVLPAPEGHATYIRQHWKEHELPEGIKLVNLLNQGWIRVSGNIALIRHVENPTVLDKLRELLIDLGETSYGIFIDDKPITVTLEELKEHSLQDIYLSFLVLRHEGLLAAQNLPVRTADDGSDAYSGDIGEWQNSWTETTSDGSKGPVEQGYAYLPQDWTKEVWWSRELLDYLKKNYPGKKDVMPPEPDNGYPTQASDVVRRLQKRAEEDMTLEEAKKLIEDWEYYGWSAGGRLGNVSVEVLNLEDYGDEFVCDVIIYKDDGKKRYHAVEYSKSALLKRRNVFTPDKAREWEKRWQRRSSLKKRAWDWDSPEYRWEWTDSGQGHYQLGEFKEVLEQILEYSKTRPRSIIALQQWKPEQGKDFTTIQNGEIVNNPGREWEKRWQRRGNVTKKIIQGKLALAISWNCPDVKCPKCGDDIHYLFESGYGSVQWAMDCHGEYGEPDYELEDYKWTCPECYKAVAHDEDEAVKVLQPQEDPAVKKWEQRWQRRGSLQKTAWGTPSVRQDDFMKVYDSVAGEDKQWRDRGNLHYSKSGDIMTVRYYATDVVKFDIAQNKILNVSCGQWHNSNTSGVIHQVLRLLYNLGYPKIETVGYCEYDSRWTPEQREAKKTESLKYLSQEEIDKLTESPNVKTRINIAKGYGVLQSTLRKLADDPDLGVVQAVLDNHNCPLTVARDLAESENPEVRLAVAQSKWTDLMTRRDWEKDREWTQGERRHNDFARLLVHAYASDPDVRVRAAVADSIALPDEDVEKLSKDRSVVVRKAVWHNVSLFEHPDIIEKLVKDKHPDVRFEIASSSTDVKVLTELAKDEAVTVRLEVAKNSHTSDEVMWELAQDPAVLIRRVVAGKAEQPIRNSMVGDSDIGVRKLVAETTEDKGVLLILAKDPEREVRMQVVRNVYVDIPVLTVLNADADAEIAGWAKERLATRFGITGPTPAQEWEKRWTRRSSLDRAAVGGVIPPKPVLDPYGLGGGAPHDIRYEIAPGIAIVMVYFASTSEVRVSIGVANFHTQMVDNLFKIGPESPSKADAVMDSAYNMFLHFIEQKMGSLPSDEPKKWEQRWRRRGVIEDMVVTGGNI